MGQFSSTASVLASRLRDAIGAVINLLGPSGDGLGWKYHPEEHYMRGPGPKWRAKHFGDRASAGGT